MPALFDAHTYAFCDALVDWPTARAECEARGMKLARIDDALENGWVVLAAVFPDMGFRRQALWIGAYEPLTDGDWHWTDGEAFWLGGSTGMPVNGLYTNWNPGEPNNATGPEACAAIELNGTTWYDFRCSTPAFFVCEAY